MALKNRFNWIWPSITDTVSAKKASRQGVWACGYCVGGTLLLVGLNVFGIRLYDMDMTALLGAFLFIIIGWGIYKMNRFAAIAGLVLFIIERVVAWSEYGPKSPVVAIIVTLAFVTSVRGIFAYHRYAIAVKTLPSCPTCGVTYVPSKYNHDDVQSESPELSLTITKGLRVISV